MPRDYATPLIARQTLSTDACLLTFKSKELASSFVPGQFTMVRVAGSGLLLRRPYSFCDADAQKGHFTLLVKEVGQGTRALAALPVGASITCLGPLGSCFQAPPPERTAVIVAGGVGIAPFVGFCRALADAGRRAVVLLGGRSEADLYLRHAFVEFGMEVRSATEDGTYGHRGRVTELLAQAIDENDPVELYSCGPSAMLVKVAELAHARGIPHQVSIERRMGCGMGCCLGCVVFTRTKSEEVGEYRRSCTEGPVFNADDIRWERDRHPV